MAESIVQEGEKAAGGGGGTERGAGAEEAAGGKSRKEKRKEKKKNKRKEKRREMAEKEREEEERRANDPEEQRRLKEMEDEEKERMERERKEFEERERMWMEQMLERKRKEEEEEAEREREEERSRKELEAQQEEEAKKLELVENNEDDEWEYVEEGPAEIIFEGNEITIRKKKIKVPKKNLGQQSMKEDAHRPTSNPLPPQSEAFGEYQTAQQMLENVAQQVPNFGTEQDKAHCPFHLKTGACRFGQRCSRVHFYPDKAYTLLMKNMYNGPGLAWEQDEGLEYTDEEVEHGFEEFYEDVHTEFLKYGEIVNFKVCKNSSFHLRGNVYVHYKYLESAVLAYQSISGRYFAGKQVCCEFVNVTRWKVAICGEYMKSRLKTCSRGAGCNFIHCFRNPGGDYEWADWDKSPPIYWVKKMAALFGYSDESAHQTTMVEKELGKLRTSSKIALGSNRHYARRSRSRDDHLIYSSGRGSDNEYDIHEGSDRQRHINDDRKTNRTPGEKSQDFETDSDGTQSDKGVKRDKRGNRSNDGSSKMSKHHRTMSELSIDEESKNHTHDIDANELSDVSRERTTHRDHERSSGKHSKGTLVHDNKESKDRDHGEDNNQYDRERSREKYHIHVGKSSRHQGKRESAHGHTDRSRIVAIGSTRESLRDEDADEDIGRQHRPRRESSRHLLDDHGDHRCRSHDIYSDDDEWSRGKERHSSHSRKRSRHNESDISDDERRTAKRLKKKSDGGKSQNRKSYRKETKSKYSRLERGEAEFQAENEENGRWIPASPSDNWNNRRKSSVESSDENGSPHPCGRRSKSSDCNLDYYHNEKIPDRWESGYILKAIDDDNDGDDDNDDEGCCS